MRHLCDRDDTTGCSRGRPALLCSGALVAALLLQTGTARAESPRTVASSPSSMTPSTLHLAALLAEVEIRDGLDPRVMEVESRVTRDFDGDGHADLMLLLVEPLPAGVDPLEIRRRRLAVMGLREGDVFSSVQQSTCLSLATDEGGMMGDPGGMLDPRGRDSAVFGNHGGSAWRWSLSLTVAWRRGAFRVVGIDTESFHVSNPGIESSQTSINLLTGRYLSEASGPVKHHGFGAPRVEDCAALEGMLHQRLP